MGRTKSRKNKEVDRQPKSNEKSDHLTICWQMQSFDWEGPWGSDNFNRDLKTFYRETVKNWESMTWAEIYSGSGGRSKGNNNHPVNVADISTKAKKRLEKINLDDIDQLISFRITSKERMYGIRDNRALKFLWYDPNHDDPQKAVYPTRKK